MRARLLHCSYGLLDGGWLVLPCLVHQERRQSSPFALEHSRDWTHCRRILPPAPADNTWVVSKDMFGCLSWGGTTGIWWVGTRGAAQDAPTTENDPPPSNVSSVEAEVACSQAPITCPVLQEGLSAKRWSPRRGPNPCAGQVCRCLNSERKLET